MRRVWLLLACLLLPAPAWAAAAVVQKQVAQSCGTSPCTVNFAGNVTTGNAVIVGAACVNGCSSTTFAYSDATNGAYTSHVNSISASTGRTSGIGSKRNLTGGFTTVTITATGGMTGGVVSLYEVSGLSTGATVLFGSIDDASATSHPCTSSGLSGTGFALCVGNNNSGPTITPTASWTDDSGGSLFVLMQQRITTFSSETATYTTSPATTAVQAMALWLEPSAAGGCRAALNLLGVGGC